MPPTKTHIWVKHLAIPAIAPAAIIGLYFTPVTLFGCAGRGLMALAVALVSAGCAFAAIGLAFLAQKRRDPVAPWWILSTLIFTLPLALLMGPLG